MKQSIVRSPISSPVSGTIVTPVNSFPSGNAIRLTESAWEALTEYDWEQTYIVAGVGEYLGPTLVEAADWAPAAGDYYVAKTGSDANAGTNSSLPKLTIASAFNAISTSNAGPITIWVDAGTYTENIAGGYFLFTKAFAHMVTIRGKPGTRPVIINSSGSYTIRPNGTSANVRVRNMEIQGASGSLGFVFYNGTNLTNFEIVECHFNDANSRPTGISFTGASGQSNLAVKRCTFASASTLNTSASNQTGFKLIGNDYTSTNLGGISCTAGTFTLNSNKLTGSIDCAGHATTATTFSVRGNTCRNITHTSGAVGNPSTVNVVGNIVNAGSGVRGIAITGYTTGGSCNDNNVTSLGDTGIGWPIDGGTKDCIGAEIKRNRITNYGTSGHAILVSTNSLAFFVEDNVTDASGGGSYGIVLKGSSHAVRGNTFRGGTLNGILMKDANSCLVESNTIYSSGASAVALRFDNADAMEVTGNTFYVTNGVLYSLALADGDDNVVNSNNYDIDSPGLWGTMFGNTVSSLANVQAQWAANYPDSPTNDNASTDV
jgi:parallel beta-helix repeat protein